MGRDEIRRGLLAARVRELRKSQGLTQEEFAGHVGVHQTMISKIERAAANVSIDTLEQIAKVTGKSLDWLRGEDGSGPVPPPGGDKRDNALAAYLLAKLLQGQALTAEESTACLRFIMRNLIGAAASHPALVFLDDQGGTSTSCYDRWKPQIEALATIALVAIEAPLASRLAIALAAVEAPSPSRLRHQVGDSLQAA